MILSPQILVGTVPPVLRIPVYKHHAQKDVQLVTPYLYTVHKINFWLKFWIINFQRSSSRIRKHQSSTHEQRVWTMTTKNRHRHKTASQGRKSIIHSINKQQHSRHNTSCTRSLTIKVIKPVVAAVCGGTSVNRKRSCHFFMLHVQMKAWAKV